MSRRDGGCQGGPVSTHTAAGMELARVLRFGVNANYSTADSVRLLDSAHKRCRAVAISSNQLR
jgi:hypothetical protein